jgi:glutathione S-transferase
MSGVCRAVFAFVMMNKIEHELKFISLYDNEHKTPEFLAINPGGYVPVIVDDGFAICETASILGYLADTRGLQDPWYPTDLKKRAVVDRFFSWYHAHLRLNGAALPFMTVFAK